MDASRLAARCDCSNRPVSPWGAANATRNFSIRDEGAIHGLQIGCYVARRGDRSALDWVIDQYRVTEDSRSGIVSDPNREDDEHYIVKLVGRVVAVSVETVKIAKGLPAEFGG